MTPTRVLLIPAAGIGSRLRAGVPKPLYPIGGRPMIDILIDLYAPFVDRVILVAHPSAVDAITAHCAGRPVDIEVQTKPTGMLDAILIPSDRIRRYNPGAIWITWCDQVAVHPRTVSELARRSSAPDAPPLVFPVVRREHPYTHLVRDPSGTIVEILHRREADRMPEIGESEMGVFSLSREAYLTDLPAFAAEAGVGSETGERNFLPFIVWLSRRAAVGTFDSHETIEAIGVNTPEEAAQVEACLRRRSAALDGTDRP